MYQVWKGIEKSTNEKYNLRVLRRITKKRLFLFGLFFSLGLFSDYFGTILRLFCGLLCIMRTILRTFFLFTRYIIGFILSINGYGENYWWEIYPRVMKISSWDLFLNQVVTLILILIMVTFFSNHNITRRFNIVRLLVFTRYIGSSEAAILVSSINFHGCLFLRIPFIVLIFLTQRIWK